MAEVTTDNLAKQATDSESLVNGLKSGSKGQVSHDFDRSLNDYLLSQLTQVSQHRVSYFSTLKRYRKNYLASSIYSIILNDLFVEGGHDGFISIEMEDEAAQTEIKELFERLGMEEILESITPDLLHFGTYAMKPVMDETGIVRLEDIYHPSQILPITSADGTPLFYFHSNQDITDQGPNQQLRRAPSYKYKTLSEVVTFNIGMSNQKVDLGENVYRQLRRKSAEQGKTLPDTLLMRVGKSIIWDSIDKLQEVTILDKSSTIRAISDILRPRAVGIPVPATYDLTKVKDLAESYSDLMNNPLEGLATLDSLESLVRSSSAIKVLPVAGNGQTVAPINFVDNNSGPTVDEINDQIKKLLVSVGIPIELWFGTGSGKDDRAGRSMVRYAKIIKRINKGLSRTMKHLALLHLSVKFPSKTFTESDVQIKFSSNLNADELDNLESIDLATASIDSITRLMDTLANASEGSNYVIDRNKIMSGAKDLLSRLGTNFADVIVRVADEKEDSVVPVLPESDDITAEGGPPNTTIEADVEAPVTEPKEDEDDKDSK